MPQAIVTARFVEWFWTLSAEQQEELAVEVEVLERGGVRVAGMARSRYGIREMTVDHRDGQFVVLYAISENGDPVLLVGADRPPDRTTASALVSEAEQAWENYLKDPES